MKKLYNKTLLGMTVHNFENYLITYDVTFGGICRLERIKFRFVIIIIFIIIIIIIVIV